VGALLRTIVFTIFVPGAVAVLIPRWILPAGARWHADATGIVAFILAAAGASIYFWCAFWAFASYGHKKFGAEYEEYSRRVPRWLPKLSAQD
jgi:hypothetical protein